MNVHFSSACDTWTTPQTLFDELNKEFNFTLDAAALKSSAVVPNYLGPDHEYEWRRDALTVEWGGASGGGRSFPKPSLWQRNRQVYVKG
jgi:hypothetical protein